MTDQLCYGKCFSQYLYRNKENSIDFMNDLYLPDKSHILGKR